MNERTNARMETYSSRDLWHTQQVPSTSLLSPWDAVLRGLVRVSVLIAPTVPQAFRGATVHAEQCYCLLTTDNVLMIMAYTELLKKTYFKRRKKSQMRLTRLRMSLKACGHRPSWGSAEPQASLRPPSPSVCTLSPGHRILHIGQQSAARPADQGGHAATRGVRSTGTGRGESQSGPGSGPWFSRDRADGWRRLGLDGRYCCSMKNPQG